MSLDTKVKNLIINTNMTKEQYEAVDDKSNQLFFVEDSSVVDVPAPEENQSGYLHTDGVNLTWKEIELGGDYLPLSGGTMTGNLTITGNVKIQNEAGDGFFIQTGPYDGSAMVVGSTNSFTGEFQPRFYFSSNSIYPSAISSYNLGTSGTKWESVYAKRLNNGADIVIPTTGGTVVVATPPTDNGTYVLKATVVDGVVTTEWVSEA